MKYKNIRLKDLEHELEEKINLKDIFKNSMLASKYVNLLGFKYISNLDNYEIITSNLDNETKLKFIENNIILLRDKTNRNILLGLSYFEKDINLFQNINFDEIVFVDKNIIKQSFNSILLTSKDEYKYPKLSFYKLQFNLFKLFVKESKPFNKLPLYFDKKSSILYISDFMSYLYINKTIFEIDMKEENLINDLNKQISIIKYLFNNEENLIVINNSLSLNVKQILESYNFNFKVSYIEKNNFVKIYQNL